MLFQRDSSDLGPGRVRRKGAFGQTCADGGFDQVPGRDYFAADVYASRVYGVDDRGETESQVARRRFERGDGFSVAGPRPDDQIFDRECRDLRRDGLRFAQVPSEIARERRQIGDVSLPAARRAARAPRAVDAQRHVAELPRDVVMAPQHFAVNNDAHADAVRDADEDQVAHGRRVAARRPHLRQRARLPRILDVDLQPGGGGQRFANLDVAPAQRRGVNDTPRLAIDHPGDDHAHALARAGLLMFRQYFLDALAQLGHQTPGLPLGGKADDADQLPAHKVGHHQEGARHPDVHRHDAPLPRIDVKKRGLATAMTLTRGALEDQPLGQQVVDD